MIKGKTSLTSLDRLILNEPTQRFILWVIANDPKVFSAHFMMELIERQELLQPGKVPNLAKTFVIYQNLLAKKMIDMSNPLKTKITWTGQFYRVYTHPVFIPLISVLGVLIAAMAVIITIPSKEPPSNKPIEQLPKQKLQQPVSDSMGKKTKVYILNKSVRDS